MTESRPRSDPAAIIGLEVHVQLSTERKLFSPALRDHRPDAPNQHIDPFSIGLPGALPVLNPAVVEPAVRAALALTCTIDLHSAWDRKHYFYPDLPKGFQITQHRRPLATGGRLEILGDDDRRREIRIRRIHLEEDAGKSVHGPDAHTRVDFNRAGAPLIEIVSEPDLRSPAEARRFLKRLRAVLRAVGASTAHMERGELRCDANVSLRLDGPRAELKNLNSFRHVEQGLTYEVGRQREAVAAGAPLVDETRLWDAERRQTRATRTKGGAADYRYLPEPDLPVLELDPGWLQRTRNALPELPAARAARAAQRGAAARQADVLADDDELFALFDAASAAAPPLASAVAGLLLGEVSRRRNADPEHRIPITADTLCRLAALKAEGRISSPQQKQLLGEAWVQEGRFAPPAPTEAPWADRARLAPVIEQVLDRHPEIVTKYRAGKVTVLGFLLGQVMNATRGRADPPAARTLLEERLNDAPSPEDR